MAFLVFGFLNNITGEAEALNEGIKTLNKRAKKLYKNIKIFNNRARTEEEAVNILI